LFSGPWLGMPRACRARLADVNFRFLCGPISKSIPRRRSSASWWKPANAPHLLREMAARKPEAAPTHLRYKPSIAHRVKSAAASQISAAIAFEQLPAFPRFKRLQHDSGGPGCGARKSVPSEQILSSRSHVGRFFQSRHCAKRSLQLNLFV